MLDWIMVEHQCLLDSIQNTGKWLPMCSTPDCCCEEEGLEDSYRYHFASKQICRTILIVEKCVCNDADKPVEDKRNLLMIMVNLVVRELRMFAMM